MRKPPRYFDDPMMSVRRLSMAAGVLAVAVLIYSVGTFAGVLQP